MPQKKEKGLIPHNTDRRKRSSGGECKGRKAALVVSSRRKERRSSGVKGQKSGGAHQNTSNLGSTEGEGEGKERNTLSGEDENRARAVSGKGRIPMQFLSRPV